MERSGGCACGAVRFTAREPFLAIAACHCTNCQKASGGGPNPVALVPRDALTVTRGEARVFRQKGDSGADTGRAFCAACGTPLWSLPVNEPFIPIKLGAFDSAADLAPAMHIYVSSAPAWHAAPDGPASFATMPPPLGAAPRGAPPPA